MLLGVCNALVWCPLGVFSGFVGSCLGCVCMGLYMPFIGLYLLCLVLSSLGVFKCHCRGLYWVLCRLFRAIILEGCMPL